MKRSVTIKLHPSKEQAKILHQLADSGAKAWNRVNYLRRQQYFKDQIVDFNRTEKTVYGEFKREIGSATVQQISRKNAEEWVKLPRTPKGSLSAGIDLGVNNLMAVYVENGESFLVNGRPLKSIDFYWRRKIADYQSKLNKSGAKTSRKLRRMHEKAKLQAKHYINTAVRGTVRKLYELGVNRIVVGYPKSIARNSVRARSKTLFSLTSGDLIMSLNV